MSFYILFNPQYRDAEISKNWHGFPECFDSYEDAEEEAKQTLDGEDYRSYIILRDKNEA